ncbi:response regulator transcription factor [Cyanothece sp. BG0011]|uniref:response regulator transcription factor n=1 Tax=Cyanothece sp. BG0011 TaxID=2082950 RepID=UPI000D1EFE31|nr:response regulator [Cyanothece sp. BG0011]
MSKVLVIEDTVSEMELISNYLRDSGYTVIATTDAKDALGKINQHKPNVIITDLVMPGMNGLELCRSIRKNPDTQNLPIVVCTSKNQDLDRMWAMKQGADVYVTKPFSKEQLVRAIRSVV